MLRAQRFVPRRPFAPGRRRLSASLAGAAIAVLGVGAALTSVPGSARAETDGDALPAESAVASAFPPSPSWAGTLPTSSPVLATPSEVATPIRSSALSSPSPSTPAQSVPPTPPVATASVVATPTVPGPEKTPDPVTAVRFRLHVPILEYHRVKPWNGETGTARSLITPPEFFAAQMEALAEAGWRTITLGELGEDLRFGIVPAPKTFVVALDDGYEDGYQNAYPILSSHGFVATYFVIAERIGWPNFLSRDELRELVAHGSEIGNHSYTHRDVAALPPDQIVREITGASAAIAAATGAWPRSFAYPKGLGSQYVTSYLEACPGLDVAVIEGGSKPQTWANRWQIPRIRVNAGTYPSDLVRRVGRY